MLEGLKKQVLEANLLLPKYQLVKFTWGNVSGIDREQGLVAIKPSGVRYEDLKVEDIVIIDLDGKKVEGDLKPSSDTATHLELYRNFSNIGGVVHTHSRWATSFAQAVMPIEPTGTTHADHFYGPVPCTRRLTAEEIQGNYEEATGLVICETFAGKDPLQIPGVLVAEHGPFAWGATLKDALHHAIILEEIAKMAFRTVVLGNESPVQQALLDKHFLRKHGADAYYGQLEMKRNKSKE